MAASQPWTREELQQVPVAWRSAPRRWGHPLHSLCSYFAMFPPQMAATFIRWLTAPGDAVYDPFAGRGTVPFEALLQGRVGYGGDANPLAHALTRAKISIPSAEAVRRRLRALHRDFASGAIEIGVVPDDIKMLYSASTLRQLVYVRNELRPSGSVDPFLTGLVLGMLHGNHSAKGATRGFSISMPNTFAMAPNYVRKYIAEKQLVAPELDVFAMLQAKVDKYDLPDRKVSAGGSWLTDATGPVPRQVRSARPKLIFTSPPYLQVIKYGKYNWVRLWFLGQEAKTVDAGLMDSASLPKYLDFMETVLSKLRQTVAADGFVCLVIGDVRRGNDQINLAGKVWRHVAEPAGWHCHAIIADSLPNEQKVSRIWKNNPGRATKTDRLLFMSPSADTCLPPFAEIDWSETPAIANLSREER